MKNFSFKIGDVVALKSHKHLPINIQDIDYEEQTAFCIWFDEKNNLQKYRFSFSVLTDYKKTII